MFEWLVDWNLRVLEWNAIEVFCESVDVHYKN